MTLKTKQVMKIIDVSGIELTGYLRVQDTPSGEDVEWIIDDGKKYRLEEWLEKFSGAYIRLTIDKLGQDSIDESGLLEGDSADGKSALDAP